MRYYIRQQIKTDQLKTNPKLAGERKKTGHFQWDDRDGYLLCEKLIVSVGSLDLS
jgi:hypothetical protein